MSDVDELLRPLLGTDQFGEPTPVEHLEGRVRRRRLARRLAVVASAAVVAVIVAVALGAFRGADPPEQVELVGLPPEPGGVWTLHWPGGRIGAGEPTRYRQVAPDGSILFETERAGLGIPTMGIPGGLTIEADDGIDLWDAATGEIVGTVGIGRVRPRAVQDNQLAYADKNRNLHIVDITTGESRPVALPEGWTPGYGTAVFSPDGSRLAALAAQGLLLVDTATDEVNAVPFEGGASGPVVLTRDEAVALLDAEMVDPTDCPPPSAQVEYSGLACAFSFGAG